jgi:hypothetical protein
MPLDYAKLMSRKVEPTTAQYSKKDTMLYALGLGVGSVDPVDADELKYVYEKQLVALPTLAVTLAAGAMRLADPEFGINFRLLLHAEQSCCTPSNLCGFTSPCRRKARSEAKPPSTRSTTRARPRAPSCT